MRRYEVTGLGMYRCLECSPLIEPEFMDDEAPVVTVANADAHDRWHVEQAAQTDPDQQSMFA